MATRRGVDLSSGQNRKLIFITVLQICKTISNHLGLKFESKLLMNSQCVFWVPPPPHGDSMFVMVSDNLQISAQSKQNQRESAHPLSLNALISLATTGPQQGQEGPPPTCILYTQGWLAFRSHCGLPPAQTYNPKLSFQARQLFNTSWNLTQHGSEPF